MTYYYVIIILKILIINWHFNTNINLLNNIKIIYNQIKILEFIFKKKF